MEHPMADHFVEVPKKVPSPAAEAVLDAYFTHADLLNREVSHEEMIAAALRALADQVVPEGRVFLSPGTAAGIRAHILAIAGELRAQP